MALGRTSSRTNVAIFASSFDAFIAIFVEGEEVRPKVRIGGYVDFTALKFGF
jgi:hypothetical protein